MSVRTLIDRAYQMEHQKHAALAVAAQSGQLAAAAEAGLTLKEASARLQLTPTVVDAWVKRAAAEDPRVVAQLRGQIAAYKQAGYTLEEACADLGVPVKTAAELGAV